MKMFKEREPEKAISSESSKGEEEDDDYSSEDTDSEHSAPPPAVRKPRTTGQTQSVTAKNPTTPSIPKPATPVPSSQESESETESEEYSEKPKEKGNDKAAAADVVPRRVGSRRKRPTDGEIETEERRSNKMRKKQAQASEKKQAFQRIWSEADELAVLRGIVEFRAEKKCDPAAKVDSFLDFIQKNLHIEVSTKQLKDKVRRMKKKFNNNKNKGKSFKHQHEQEAHDLAEKVWGSEIQNWDKKTAHENGSQSHAEDTRAGEMVQTRAKSGRFKEGAEDGKPLEVIIIEEMKAYCRKVEIKAQQFQLLLQNMKSASY